VWVLAALCAVAAAGLAAPGIAGQIGLYLWLGVFPGMAVARLVMPRAAATTRWLLGLVLSPLVSAIAGWALVRAGLDLATAARVIGMGGWLLFAGGEARSLGEAADDPLAAPMTRFAWGWVLASCLFVTLPLLNPWTLIRSDTWVHAAIVQEIRLHGFPPIDPRFIGLRLNYVWVFHLFIAELVALRGQDAFVFMALLNVVSTGVMMALVWQLARAIADDERAARGTLVLFTLGLNAGAWLLTPLLFARAFTGEVRGLDEVRRILPTIHVGSTDVIYLIAAPFTWMVQFWDKVTLGGPLGYAYLFLLLHWWALARLLRGAGPRWLAVAFVAAVGSVLPHSVVALGLIPVSTGAVALSLLLRRRHDWLPGVRALIPFWLATLAGFAACLPYLVSVASGWSADRSGQHHQLIHPGWRMPWTVATACAVVTLFAWPGIRRAWAERRPLAAWLSLWALGILVLQCVVHLPEGNEHKFVWVLFTVLALLGGAAFPPAMDRWRARLGPGAFAAVFALVFLVPSAAFLQGFLRDPMRTRAEALSPKPGEARLLSWLRDSTSSDDVVLETRNRDLVTVLVPRRMLVATRAGADRAGFPLADFERRREITSDLFGPVARLDDDLAGLADIVRRARQVHPVAEVDLLYRAGDFAAGDAPWGRLEAAAGERATKRYEADGFRVYSLRLVERP
jgi:hypothetical protein